MVLPHHLDAHAGMGLFGVIITKCVNVLLDLSFMENNANSVRLHFHLPQLYKAAIYVIIP